MSGVRLDCGNPNCPHCNPELDRMIKGIRELKSSLKKSGIELPPPLKFGHYGGFVFVEPDTGEVDRKDSGRTE